MDAGHYVKPRPSAAEQVAGTMFAVPDVRTTPVSAPGSDTSRIAAEAIDGPLRNASLRRVMNALGRLRVGVAISREALAESTGDKESSLCARLDELCPLWVEKLEKGATSRAGLPVNAYRLTAAGRARLTGDVRTRGSR